MTLDALIMLAGVFVAVLPFLGFPNSWDNVLFLVAGFLIIALGIIVRRRSAMHRAHERSETFVENLPNRETGMPRIGHDA